MLAVTISEVIKVDNTDCAQCTQTVSYTNPDDKPYDFLGTYSTSFHRDCSDFTFTDSIGEIKAELIDIMDHPYHKEVMYSLDGRLSSGNTSEYKLKYNWPNFKDKAGFKKISIKPEFLTNYNLTIIVKDDDPFRSRLTRVKDGNQLLNKVVGGDYHVTIDGDLFISRQNISKNSRMNIRIIADMPHIDLPVIRDIAGDYVDCFAHKYVIFCIVHLLRDSLPFFNNLLSMGVNQDDIFIVGIPYSSKIAVVDYLVDDGFYVQHIDRARYVDEFIEIVKKTLLEACQQCVNTGKKLLIIEDGGYAVPLLHTNNEFKEYADVCVGAVEQTTNGIRADRRVIDESGLLFPIMNVAESKIKKERESPLVGTAIIHNINLLLQNYGIDIRSHKVGQIGYGAVGQALALEMKNDGIDVTIYDLKNDINTKAKENGFRVAQSPGELLPGKTLIIGCTGEEVVGLSELRKADREIFFVNATSKLRELKYREFLDVAEEQGKKRGIGTDYKLKGGREILIHLLADGFPINFFEESESIPDKKIQFIPALLLGAAGYLVSSCVYDNKIIQIPSELEERINHFIDLRDQTK